MVSTPSVLGERQKGAPSTKGLARPLVVQTDQPTAEVLKERLDVLDAVEKMHTSAVQWFDCDSPAQYRQMRKEGSNGFPKPHVDPKGETVTIRGRTGEGIELRVLRPESKETKGVFLHFHAGGFVIGSAHNYDVYLRELSDALDMIMLSVDYRLAPEHSFPAGHHDCLDAALYALSPEGETQLGGSLTVMGGESAGGSLTVWVAAALRDCHGIDVRSRIQALVPSYGMFDMSITPSGWNHSRRCILGKVELFKFIEATFGQCHFGDRKNAQVSPLYADLANLPPALFMIGTEDPLYDDSVFMANRWYLAGNECKLRIWKAVPHAFTLFPMGEVTREGKQEMIDFVLSKTS